MKRLLNKRGMTLVEAMIAILLLGMAAAAYAQLFPPSVKSRKTTDNAKVATNAAQQKLEEIRDEARSVGGFYKISSTTFEVPDLVDGAGVVTVYDFGSTELKKVSVTVSWGGAANTGGTVTIQTLISAFG